MKEASSAQLLATSLNGDPPAREPAMRSLLVRHLPSLRVFVRLQVDAEMRERESVSDLVQSVCRQALLNAASFEFRSESAFRNWIYGAVLNKVRDRRAYWAADKRDARREQLRPWTPAQQNELAQSYGGCFAPSEVAMARERYEELERAFDRLPERQRRVLCLSRVAGLTHAEIASQLGITEANSRQLLKRALVQLAAFLEDLADEG